MSLRCVAFASIEVWGLHRMLINSVGGNLFLKLQTELASPHPVVGMKPESSNRPASLLGTIQTGISHVDKEAFHNEGSG